MNFIPIPKIPRGLSDSERMLALEQAIGVAARNFQELMKPHIQSRNLGLEIIQVRHINEECYGTLDDLTNLRLGDTESAGVLGRLSRADHKHAIDPILVLKRTDPAQITGATNDWGLDTGYSLFFVDASGAFDVTGIAGGTDGRVILLVNDGANNITLKHASGSSLVGNRFKFSGGADIVLGADDAIMLIYDSVAQVWRELGGTSVSPSGSGSAGQVVIWTGPSSIGGDPGLTFDSANDVLTIGASGQNVIRTAVAAETVFNETGINLDFRVEGDTVTNLFFVDASTDRVGIGTAVPFTYASMGLTISGSNSAGVHFYSSGSAADNRLYDILADTTPRMAFRIVNDAGSVATNWLVVTRSGTTVSTVSMPNGAVSIGQYLNVGTTTDASAIGDFSAGLTGGRRVAWDESASTWSQYNSAGALAVRLSGVAATETVFNEQGNDIDFRVEGDTDSALLHCDAGFDNVAVGFTPSSAGTKFEARKATTNPGSTIIGVSGSVVPTLTANNANYVAAIYAGGLDSGVINTGVTATSSFVGLRAELVRYLGGATDNGTLASQIGAHLRMGIHTGVGANATNTNTYGVKIDQFGTAGTQGTVYGLHVSGATTGGVITTSYGIYLSPLASSVSAANTYAIRADTGSVQFNPIAGQSFVWNENAVDADLRVEGDTDASLFFCDASTDRVSVGVTAGSATHKFHVNGNSLLAGTVSIGASDVILQRITANSLALGTSTSAQSFDVHNTTDGTNREYLQLAWSANICYLRTAYAGTGSARQLNVGTYGAGVLSLHTNSTDRWHVTETGGMSAQANYRFSHGTSALATNATEGFLHIQSCAGTPTGVPASIPSGQIPLVWDSTNNILYAYDGGWVNTGAGGSVSGSGVANQVAYWSAGTTLAGDAGMTYDAATDTLTVAGNIAAGGATDFAGGAGVIAIKEGTEPSSDPAAGTAVLYVKGSSLKCRIGGSVYTLTPN